MSGFPDTYLYGLSNKSVIRTFRPLATDSIVSIRGILPLLQIVCQAFIFVLYKHFHVCYTVFVRR
nr:MAG TPA: hypothetical protein [Caudoviricetes sp.]